MTALTKPWPRLQAAHWPANHNLAPGLLLLARLSHQTPAQPGCKFKALVGCRGARHAKIPDFVAFPANQPNRAEPAAIFSCQPFSPGFPHNPYNGVICNDVVAASGVFTTKELWKFAKCKQPE